MEQRSVGTNDRYEKIFRMNLLPKILFSRDIGDVNWRFHSQKLSGNYSNFVPVLRCLAHVKEKQYSPFKTTFSLSFLVRHLRKFPIIFPGMGQAAIFDLSTRLRLSLMTKEYRWDWEISPWSWNACETYLKLGTGPRQNRCWRLCRCWEQWF